MPRMRTRAMTDECAGRAHDVANGETPLSMVPPGETVELAAIRGGRMLRRRLADLGFNIGMTVRVVQNPYRGPLIVAVKEDARVGIGRGEAHKIWVRRRKGSAR